MKSKPTLAFILFAAVAIVAVLFIWTSNNHLECENNVVHSTDKNGSSVVTSIHICKERFSF